MSLEELLDQRQDLWRGRTVSAATPPGVSTGFAALDAILPWRGWPPGALSEILDNRPGGAFALVQPALVRLSGQARWLLLVDPPWIPYAPTLFAAGVDLSRLAVVEAGKEAAWAAEQGLRSGACSAVLAWGGRWESAALRRLQLAAEAGNAMALLFRGEAAVRQHSPAALRLQVRPSIAGVEVTVLKQRGARAGATLELPLWAEPDVLPSAILPPRSFRRSCVNDEGDWK
ncbi:MAG: translesion DNA synthesis-associated protein ImuA [Pseudomonadota bacterium]|nr:translesion DNA synthesis-associated protein ImuA [Pseudomonadota bacterium]